MAQTPLFHPFLPEALKNPYPFYDRLREEDPLHWSALGFWMVFRHEDILTFLRHDRFSLEPSVSEVDEDAMPFEAACNRWYRLMDPVNPGYFRQRLTELLSREALQRHCGAWRDEAERLTAALPEWGISDLIARFVKPLVLGIVADLLGVPENARFRFRSILTELNGRLFELAGMGGRISSKNIIFGDLLRMYLELVAGKQFRGHAHEDALTALLASPENGDPVAEEDLVDMLVFLLHTLTENTAHGLGNAFVALLRHPNELARLDADPEGIPDAFEECLRFDCPIQFYPITAREDVMLHEKTIHRGQSVWLSLGAAHRDKMVLPDANRFRLDRETGVPDLALNLVPVIDATLMRFVAHSVLPVIVPRLCRANLMEDGITWQTASSLSRGPRTLPVRWSENP